MGGLKKIGKALKKAGRQVEKAVKRAAPIVVGAAVAGPVGALAGYHGDKMLRAKRKMAAAVEANSMPDRTANPEDGDRAPTLPEQIQMLRELHNEGVIREDQFQAALNKLVA
eukprot:TRINITY_DN86252_c0_g1_i1.p1 TRINITY_DN86252_c0_g1~~TRINITY_DN86252_c0_g1_i1.p1  ORF type:complete len:112 (-),score=28.35 TRINITY_DN86252_c0_g1_i1:166-501(-)